MPPPPPRRAPPPPATPPPPPRRAPPPPSPPIRPPPPPTPRPHAPPPPSHPLAPPPPHISPPAPVPPPPSPPPHIVIIVVFVSFGGLLLLACLAALFCWHKKKRRETERKAEVHNLSGSGHFHVHKATESGPGGAKATVLSIDEDLKFQEVAGESSSAAGAGSHHTPWSWHRRQQEGKAENKAELINVTEHIHVDEKIVSGPQGQKIEILSEDEDIRFEEAGRKEKGDERSKTRITKT
uniref:Uncharacterized protein n=1 Tax=Oryza meridionalis TaxID=40149 RepID=A0A0E0EGY2_9ORYZ